MKRKDAMIIAALTLITVLSCAYSITAKAFDKPAQIQAVGIWAFDADESGEYGDNPEDFVIAAEDFYYLYELCR